MFFYLDQLVQIVLVIIENYIGEENFSVFFAPSGMWQYSNIGGEGGSVGPSTSSVHPSPSTGHQVGTAPGTQPELTDMLQILDQSAPTNFEDLNMFNTNFE